MRSFAGVLLVAVIAAGAPAARAQVSPGPLAAAHHDLDGLSNCLKCHVRNQSMSNRCLACHTEIAWYRAAKRGYHARVTARECATCHPDHAGVDFKLIQWDEGTPDRFDHTRAGWNLTGKHATLKCRDCHSPANQKAPVAARIRKKDHAESWLGLETACNACHVDPHANRFGGKCETCHRMSSWGEIITDGFDHDKTRYPLRGRHSDLSCAACHDATSAWGPKPPFEKCGACHQDAHAGSATIAGKPVDCATCHDVSGFGSSTFTVAMHRKSRYPLDGKHASVACAKCHVSKPAGVAPETLGSSGIWMRPRFDACERCHADAHGDQLAASKPRSACKDCHTVDGFRPSTYTRSDHASLRLPLTGAHAPLDCRGCHAVGRVGLPALAQPEKAGPAKFVFRIPELTCEQCHRDPHQGRFAAKGARSNPAGCLGCHDVSAFRPARVDVAVHQSYRFPLEGAHQAVPCAACHKELATRSASRTLIADSAAPTSLLFTIAKQTCASCHSGPHGNQFDARKDHGACEACHGVDSFRPASRFRHDRDTPFRLEGAHARVACDRCHKPTRDRGGNVRVVYQGVPTRCEACHAS
jgi:hypothetical protein